MKARRRLKRIAYIARPLLLVGRGIKAVRYWRNNLENAEGGEILRIGSNSLNRNRGQEELNTTKV